MNGGYQILDFTGHDIKLIANNDVYYQTGVDLSAELVQILKNNKKPLYIKNLRVYYVGDTFETSLINAVIEGECAHINVAGAIKKDAYALTIAPLGKQSDHCIAIITITDEGAYIDVSLSYSGG